MPDNNASSMMLVNLDFKDAKGNKDNKDNTFESVIFANHPVSFTLSQHANYREHDTTHMMPIIYRNRTGNKYRFPELWLDNSRNGDSVMPEVRSLLALLEETRRGMPPRLVLIWGDGNRERVVLTNIEFEFVHFYTPAADPVRAKCSLELDQIQGEAVEFSRDAGSGYIVGSRQSSTPVAPDGVTEADRKAVRSPDAARPFPDFIPKPVGWID